jgi:hypothetical protein
MNVLTNTLVISLTGGNRHQERRTRNWQARCGSGRRLFTKTNLTDLPKSRQIKSLQNQLAENANQLEMRRREEDMKRQLEQSRSNRELIDGSKPKAQATKRAGEAKQAKAARTEAAKVAKTEAKNEKERKRKQTREAKAAKIKDAKQKPGKSSEHQENSSDEEESGEHEEHEEKELLHWKEWVIMTHKLRKVDGTPWFRVAMCGYPPEKDEKPEWAERHHLVKDGAKALIDRCIQERANFPPHSDLLLASKQRPKKAIQAPASAAKSRPCQHHNYQESFKMEDNPGFCGPGEHLHGLMCGGDGCKKAFAANLKEVKRMGADMASRPTKDKPVHCCLNIAGRTGDNRKVECRHALCNQCWTKAVLGEDDVRGQTAGGKRKRTTRTVNRSNENGGE